MDNLEAPASSKPRLSLPFLRDIRARRHRRSYNVTKKSTSVDHDNEGMSSIVWVMVEKAKQIAEEFVFL